MSASIQFFLDIAIVTLLGVAPILCLLIAWRSRRGLAAVRIAYLGYALCALIVGLFQWHLQMDGPEIFMMFEFFLIPIVIAGALASIMTVVAGSNATLWALAGTTVALGIFQFLTFIGILGTFMNVIALGYVALVLAACVHRRRDWWPGPQIAPG